MATPVIKFWYSPGACSLAVHILLREAGISFEPVRINVRHGAPEELRAVNEKMRVPVLVIDNEIITEVPAILTAISQMVPERHFLGRTNMEIVRSYEWMNWLSGHLHGQGFGGVFRPKRFAEDKDMHAAVRANGLKTVQEDFGLIEGWLKGVHAVGDEFTAVDAYMYVFYRWGTAELKVDMVRKYPKYSALVAELLKRQAVKDAIEDEKIDSAAPKI